jgi:hypothetical protein
MYPKFKKEIFIPVCILNALFFYRRGLELLVSPNGWVDKTMNIGIKGMFELIRRGYVNSLLAILCWTKGFLLYINFVQVLIDKLCCQTF